MNSHPLDVFASLRHAGLLLGLAATSFLQPALRAQTPGTLDSAYAPVVDNGTVFTAALQPDGKLVIGGSFTSVESVAHTRLARLNVDGTVDGTFTSSADANVSNLAVLADGGLLVAGSFTTVNATARLGLAKLDNAGVLDGMFDPQLNGFAYALAVQQDGPIIVGGAFTQVAGTGRNGIARLTSAGALDTSFNPGTGTGGTGDVRCVAVQPDGKVLIGGTFTQIDGTPRNRIARLKADGSLDLSFNPGTGASSVVYGIEVQPDGKILVAGGFLTFNSAAVGGLVRLNADGSVESKAAFDIGSGSSFSVQSPHLQTDGKIIIGGGFARWNDVDTNSRLRLNTNGSKDTSFSTSNSLTGSVQAVLQQLDGRVLLTGGITNYGGTARNRVVRLVNGTAVQTLQTVGTTKAQWWRSGTAPEVQYVTFELSTDGGANWSPLGNGTRVPGGWELTGLSLPASGKLRARGRTTGDAFNGSSLFEQSVTFDQAVTVPVVESPTSSALASTGATLGGTVTSDGGSAITERGVVCVPTTISSSPAIGAPGVLQFTTAGTTGVFTLGATSLMPGVNYTFRAYAINGIGTGYSSAAVFSTVNSVPVLSAPTKVYISNSTATLGGTVVADGGSPIIARGVVLAPSSVNNDPQIGGTGVTVVAAGSSDSVFAVMVSGLSSGIGYSFRAYATNGTGTGYTSPVSTFTTHAAQAGALEAPNPNPTGSSFGNAIAVQADGKVLFGGGFSAAFGVAHSNLLRLNTDGTEDSAFSPSIGGLVSCIATLPDGKILIGGQMGSVNGVSTTQLARLNADGSLDTGFTPNVSGNVNCIAVAADGSIFIGGNFNMVGVVSRVRIAKLASSGALDATFDPGTGFDSVVNSLALQPDGKLIVGGNFSNFNGSPAKFLARLQTNGALESTATFNPGTGPSNTVYSVVLQPDGRILIGGGFSTVNGVARACVARLGSDGSVEDNTVFKLGSGFTGTVFALALQANGKILAGGGFTTVSGTLLPGIVRLLPDGSVESKSGFDHGTGVDNFSVANIALQANGKIWIGGNFTSVDGTPRRMLARLSNDEATQLLSAVSASTV